MNRIDLIVVLLLGAVAADAAGAIRPVSPREGAVVALLPDSQKHLMSLPSHAARRAELETNAFAKARWQGTEPLSFAWCCDEGEKGPWKLELGKRSDLSDAREWYSRETNLVIDANLEVGARYHWRVTGGRRPYEGEENPPKDVFVSPVFSFATEDLPPRWIALEGKVENVRDLGGWRGSAGRRVRQGRIFRGAALNANSVTGERAGKSRLTVNDVDYLTRTLGIRTDLDLRSAFETGAPPLSPMGPSVRLVCNSSYHYRTLFTPKGKKAMAENFRLFCDERNYPVFFHCSVGADRTGSLAYVLCGVLGVSRNDLELDWEATFYPEFREMREEAKREGREYWSGLWHFDEGFSAYGDASSSWNERIRLYLLDCGITLGEIETFRRLMLEE